VLPPRAPEPPPRGPSASRLAADERARAHLDSRIDHYLAQTPPAITKAKNRIEWENQFLDIKRKSQGYSATFAAFFDVLSLYLLLGVPFWAVQPVDLYYGGYIFFFGMGKGLPLVISKGPPRYLKCDVKDFTKNVDRFGIDTRNGTAGQRDFSRLNGSAVSEFDLTVRTDLSCILGETYEEDAEVSFDLDELNALLLLRLRLQSS
jgi:hypothetical protein